MKESLLQKSLQNLYLHSQRYRNFTPTKCLTTQPFAIMVEK